MFWQRIKFISFFFIINIISQLQVINANENKDKIIQDIIANSIASYPGKCACPYQRTSNGSRCGKRSAYSKPGGYEPLCFPSDVTDEMISSLNNPSLNNTNSSSDFIGKVFVTDGDTIKSGSVRIRLHGIDAPETKQTCKKSNGSIYYCGQKSTAFLKTLIKSNEVSCVQKDKDRYGRIIAVCYVDGKDINAVMVEEGWAIAYRYYSKDYIKEEERAKNQSKGIWQGSFVEPYIWRKNN